MRRLRTHVAIIGGGPAGLLLSQILHRHEVDSVVLEKHSREHVLRRIRAGLLEWGTVEVLRDAGVGERMDRDFAATGRGSYFGERFPGISCSFISWGCTNPTSEATSRIDHA